MSSVLAHGAAELVTVSHLWQRTYVAHTLRAFPHSAAKIGIDADCWGTGFGVPFNVPFLAHLFATTTDACLSETGCPKSPSRDSKHRELVRTIGFQHTTDGSANARAFLIGLQPLAFLMLRRKPNEFRDGRASQGRLAPVASVSRKGLPALKSRIWVLIGPAHIGLFCETASSRACCAVFTASANRPVSA